MTDLQVVFLGIIAASLVGMAAAQLFLALAMARAVKQVSHDVTEFRREVKPLLDNASRIAEDASRVARLAVVQAERVDLLLKSTTARVDETFALVQGAVVEPMRQGTAILAALKAGFGAIRAFQGRAASSRDDEDPLFVG